MKSKLHLSLKKNPLWFVISLGLEKYIWSHELVLAVVSSYYIMLLSQTTPRFQWLTTYHKRLFPAYVICGKQNSCGFAALCSPRSPYHLHSNNWLKEQLLMGNHSFIAEKKWGRNFVETQLVWKCLVLIGTHHSYSHFRSQYKPHRIEKYTLPTG